MPKAAATAARISACDTCAGDTGGFVIALAVPPTTLAAAAAAAAAIATFADCAAGDPLLPPPPPAATAGAACAAGAVSALDFPNAVRKAAVASTLGEAGVAMMTAAAPLATAIAEGGEVG